MERTEIALAVRTVCNAASPARKRQFAVTIVVMLLGAGAELLTIGAILPFLTIISDPARATRNHLVRGLLELLGPWPADHLIATMTLLLMGASIIAAAIRVLLTWSSLRFVLQFGHDLGTMIFGRMLRQPYDQFVMRNTSEFLTGMEKLQGLIYSLLLPVMQGVTSSIIATMIVVLLFFIDPMTASLAALSMISVYVLVSVATRGALRRSSKIWAQAAAARVRIIQEGLGGLRDILLDGKQSVFERGFAEADHRYRSAQSTVNFISLSPRYIVESAGIILIALLAVYLTGRPGGLIAAIPILGALAIGAQRLLPLLQTAYAGYSAFQGNRQVLIDVAELVRMRINPAVGTLIGPLPFTRSITLDAVTFSYAGRQPALVDVSLTIARGERIGVVGATGSGKSTLMDLLLGLLRPTQGQMLIDGAPLGDANLGRWQAQIAHVPQMIYLSDSSVAANIAFGEPEDSIDHDRVRAVARQAEVDGFIQDLEQGYSTPVGERGIRLSGGQRQRLGIARALYKGATVLIFDEATSALDHQTEAAIMASIDRLSHDITVITIAHRTTTLANCDRIVRLDKGRIAEVVSYSALAG